jgi:hypothetical protein
MSSVSRAFFIGLGVFGFVLAIRLAACRIVLSEEGIRVINPLRAYRLRWDEVCNFRLGRWGVLPRNGIAELVDGTSLGIWSISARNPNFAPKDSAAEGLVKRLNAELDRRRAGP